MTGVTTTPATMPEGMSPKTWSKIQQKHGKPKPHFQTGSPKVTSPNAKGKKAHSPKFGNVNDTSHQIQQLPTHQSAQEKAAHNAEKVAERNELAEKAGFGANQKKDAEFAQQKKMPDMQSKGGTGNLGKIRNPSVCKNATMPTGRHH